MKEKTGMKIINWDTILSKASRVWLKKMTYDGILIVSLGSVINDIECEIEFNFGERLIFRNIQEEFFTPLWNIIASSEGKVGATFILQDSRWLKELNKDEIFAGTMKDCCHYVISTEDDIIEIITANEPIVKFVSW